ncbi:MAG: hypothetical protein M0P43_04975 [Arcobacteraceae bacterium]|nr:hypothetical protein [Arcobacteraceae bacterium]
MKSSSAIYINVVKLPNQLKLDYTLIKNNNIIKNDQASFLVYDETMTKDIFFKLEALQKENTNHYISTILNHKEQYICKNDELSKYNTNDYEFVQLYNKTSVVAPKSIIFETKHYFEKSGLDYLFSPYQILTHYILDNPSKSNMLVLIISNIVYIMITDASSNPIYYDIKELTPFDEIKNSQFYDDEIKGQQLFDEIYFFELQEIIKVVLEQFYATTPESFIEKINILYTLKQLDNSSIESFKEEYMMDVSYHLISLDSYMYELANSKTSKKSFITPRKKTSSIDKYLWIGAACVASVATAYILFSFYNNKAQEEVIAKTEQIKQAQVPNVTLTNHIAKNTSIINLIKEIFDSIPYNTVLNEFILDSNDSIIVGEFLEKDSFVKLIKPNMLALYEESIIRFDEENGTNSPIFIGVIKNSTRLAPTNTQNPTTNYKQTSFSYTMMNDSIKHLSTQDSQIVYLKSETQDNITKNIFELNLRIKSPQELFDFIDRINTQDYSITIQYPIRMVKESTTNDINVKMYLSFNQAI